MKLSEDRLDYLIKKIAAELLANGVVIGKSELQLRSDVRMAFVHYIKKHEEISEKARHKISSMKRQIAEGSPEWRVIFRQFFEEELNKL